MVTEEVVMYSTSVCGYCVRLKRGLDIAGIAYREVNIEFDPDAADLVSRVNGGSRTVPTVVLPDGRALTNPSVDQLRAALAAAPSTSTTDNS